MSHSEKTPEAQTGPLEAVVRWVFGWYYRRVPEFFHQWPPRKSFRLLVDNYRHLSEVELPTERKIAAMYAKEADALRKELRDLKFRHQGFPPEMVEAANRIFGTDLPSGCDCHLCERCHADLVRVAGEEARAWFAEWMQRRIELEACPAPEDGAN